MAGDQRIRRERLVTELSTRGISDPRVLDAMRRVPRELFVDDTLRAKAYSDSALPIGEGQTISQPWIVAKMCELAEPDLESRVLEVGTGSGYHAAVLSRLFGQVYTVERHNALSVRARKTMRTAGFENVHFKVFDGTYGWSEFAPYEAIVVTAGSPDLPRPLFEQLAEGGRLIIPVGRSSDDREQELVRFIKQGGQPKREVHCACRFVPLVGRYGWES